MSAKLVDPAPSRRYLSVYPQYKGGEVRHHGTTVDIKDLEGNWLTVKSIAPGVFQITHHPEPITQTTVIRPRVANVIRIQTLEQGDSE